MENNTSLITTIPLSSLNELFSALSKAQAQMHAALKTSDNPFFKSKYADFGEVVAASRPALSANGLSVIQRIICIDDGNEVLHSILGHSSGQYIDSIMRIKPQKSDVQSLGSYITYLKRYAYAALVGVVTEDDDGEGAVIHNGRESGSNVINDSRPDGIISREQLQTLNQLLSSLSNATVLENNIKKFNSISDLKELRQEQYVKVLAYIKKELEA